MGGFGIFVLIIMIIRHVGACIIEHRENEEGKRRFCDPVAGTYIGYKGKTRLLKNNHICITGRDELRGRYTKDVETGEVCYYDLVQGYREFLKVKDLPHEGTTFRYKPPVCGMPIYIDYETCDIYYLTQFMTTKGSKNFVWFYTDFDTQTKVIRKSDRQLSYEQSEEGKGKTFYDISEVNLNTAFNINPSVYDYPNNSPTWRIENIEKAYKTTYTGYGKNKSLFQEEYILGTDELAL